MAAASCSMAAATNVAAANVKVVRTTSTASLRPSVKCAPLRVQHSQHRGSVVASASKLTSSFLGGGDPRPGGGIIGKSGSSKTIKPEDVVLESEAGIDYTPLKEALEAGEFQKADDITRALLIELAGEDAKGRGWVYFSEVKTISVKDFKTMDSLWVAYSEGKFGFSVQKNLWVQCSKRWPKFFKRINWVQGENNIYRKWPAEFNYTKEAEKGHLPLTNALRGTELIQAIFKHPAFEVEEKKKVGNTAPGSLTSKSL
uniref:GUN4-like domain-containing protein n=2 Tax=Eukaryota TaxID=2759 RepID=A0A7S1X7N6_9CHLO|mmetsp:Transcript_37011/g.66235  ORF Transcript_37011/g.66235 Transcript_37011/m.66235 type:complete len:257 (+) Transcript_37011:158-928(+)